MSSFDPSRWLASFEAGGGSYALLPSGRLWLGALGISQDLTDALAEIVGHPERRAAVTDLVKQRAMQTLDLEHIAENN